MPNGNLREYLSFSSTDTFKKCPTLYRHKYIDGTPSRDTIQEPLILGSLAHTLLEHRLRDYLSVHDALKLSLQTWLEDICGLKTVDNAVQQAQGLGIYPDSVYSYAIEASKLLLRAAPNYKEPDAIRNADGSAPKNPFEYPNKKWKEEYESLHLAPLRQQIDTIATQLNPDFRPISLANICAWGTFMAKNFSKPQDVQTLEVEWEFGKEANRLFYVGDYWLKGAIDWIALYQGELAIIDHKSGRNQKEEIDIQHHPQLNLYASIYYELTDKLPEWIGISEPYFQSIRFAPLDVSIMAEVRKSFEQTAQLINLAHEHGSYLRHHPSDYNSPCLRRDWKTKAVTYCCPYIQHCWPEYAWDLTQLEGITFED